MQHPSFQIPRALRSWAGAACLATCAASSLAATVSYSPQFSSGWNLVGNSATTALDVKAAFSTQTSVLSVWKWDAAGARWAFYAPSLDTAGTLNSYAASKGYAVLASVNAGEGYWVNTQSVVTLGAQSGAGYSLAAANLLTGWNLAATADDVAPAAFTTTVGNVTTLWAWDNASNAWLFHAPSLLANNTLASYIQSKGYKDFGAVTLGNGRGFWVNYAGSGAVTANACVVDTNAPLPGGGVFNTKQCYTNRPTGYTCDQAGLGGVATTYHAQNGYPSGSVATYAYALQATCPASATTFDMGGWYVSTLAGGDPVGYLKTGLDALGYRDSASGTSALFDYPEGITSDGTSLYVTDNHNNRIRQIVIATGAVTTFAGSGVEGSSNGVGTAASFIRPNGITTDGTSLFVLDYFTGDIRRINLASKAVTTLASVRGAEILTTDGSSLYVVGTTILKVSIATGAITSLAGAINPSTQLPIVGAADGTGAAAQFRTISGLATDGKILYVLDSGRIRKVDLATQVVTTWVTAGAPAGRMFIDNTYLYVAGAKIKKIALATGVITNVAGGNSVFSDGFGVGAGNSVPGQIGQFYSPRDIVGVGANLYVTDSSRSSRIRKISP